MVPPRRCSLCPRAFEVESTGPHPSLTDLDDGDLKHHTDFRSVYASCLDWLDVDAKAVLGGEFPRLKWQT